ncbi:MAG: hypothetical protein ACKO34_05630 [Vampirovibrionales bacterium]
MTFTQTQLDFYSHFQHHLADGQRWCDETATDTRTPVYLLGQALLKQAQFDTPTHWASYGIQEVWFARYFSPHCPLPTLQGDVRVIPNSQLRLKFSTFDGQPLNEATHQALQTYLLAQLEVPTPHEVKFEALEANPHCCHSPCFGCLRFDVDQALERQGEQGFLLAMKQAQQA